MVEGRPKIKYCIRSKSFIETNFWKWTLCCMINEGPHHGLRTLREEIAFTARPKIHSHSQIFRYGRSIFSATSAQIFRYLWFMPSLGVRSPWTWSWHSWCQCWKCCQFVAKTSWLFQLTTSSLTFKFDLKLAIFPANDKVISHIFPPISTKTLPTTNISLHEWFDSIFFNWKFMWFK